ncbi:ankyrin, partial [Aspergillus sclerotioniger CBS 115572]
QVTAALDYQHAFDCVVPSDEPRRSKMLNLVEDSTPLTAAVEGGHTAVVRMLLESDEDVDEKDGLGGAPIHWAVFNGHVEIGLIQAGADIDARMESNGWTALFIAAIHERVDDMELLLGCGADVDARASTGVTVLFHAATVANVRMVKLLIDHKAQIKAIGPRQATPLD